MCVSLETLELSAEQLESARDQVRQRAYELWQAAGRPLSDGGEFWRQAEEDWISHNYVPLREFELDGASAVCAAH